MASTRPESSMRRMRCSWPLSPVVRFVKDLRTPTRNTLALIVQSVELMGKLASNAMGTGFLFLLTTCDDTRQPHVSTMLYEEKVLEEDDSDDVDADDTGFDNELTVVDVVVV